MSIIRLTHLEQTLPGPCLCPISQMIKPTGPDYCLPKCTTKCSAAQKAVAAPPRPSTSWRWPVTPRHFRILDRLDHSSATPTTIIFNRPQVASPICRRQKRKHLLEGHPVSVTQTGRLPAAPMVIPNAPSNLPPAVSIPLS